MLQGAHLTIDEDLAVTVNGEPAGGEFDLFNLRAFHQLHVTPERRSYYLLLCRLPGGSPVAAVHFHEDVAGHFESPWRGSHGGFALARGAQLSLENMERFVRRVEDYLRAEGARRMTLVLPPLAYHLHESSAWLNVLLRAGYAIARHELSYAIDVDARPFESRIDYGNRKRLRKCLREGLTARPLDGAGLAAAYDVIVQNRRKKGYTVSMTWPALEAMRERFPDRMMCFGVHGGERLLAAAVCLRVNVRTLYVFYWGEIEGAEALSPVTLLADRIYGYCAVEGLTLLDLGTATIDGVPNHGLVRYKKNLGCEESLKLIVSKALS